MSLIGDLIALAVTFGLTGWLLSLVVLPEQVGAAHRTGLTLATAVPGALLVALPGLLLDRLGATAFLVGLAVLILVAAIRTGTLAAVRRSPGEVLGRLRATPRRVAEGLGRRTLVPALVTAAAVAVAWSAVLAPQLEVARSSGLPRHVTVWFYVDLVEDVADMGGVPESHLEWGATHDFPSEYFVSTVHAATSAELAGGFDLELLERYRLAMVVAGLLAAFAVWRRFLPAWWALIAGSLTIAASHFATRFVSYRPETFGFVLALWSTWLFDEALERRSKRWAALAGVVSASSFLAHAEAWFLTGPLWLGILIARVVFPDARRRDADASGEGDTEAAASASGRERLGKLVGPLLRPVAIVAAVFVASVVVLSLAGDGGARVAGQAGLTEERSERIAPIPAGDPTWTLHGALYRESEIGTPPPELRSIFVDKKAREPFVGLRLQSLEAQLGLLALVLFVLPALLRRPSARAARAVLVIGITAAGIVAVGMIFTFLYSTYVPQRLGPQRVIPTYGFPLAGLLAVASWLAATRLSELWRRFNGLGGRAVYPVATAVLSVGLLLLLTPGLGGRSKRLEHVAPIGPNLSETAYEAYQWIGENTPTDAIVMANGYTEGSLRAVSGRLGWLDGRAPYLGNEAFRADSIRKLIDARAYFRDPVVERDLLPAEVDYVLAATTNGSVDLGGSRFAAGRSQLSDSPDLRLVRSFEDGELLLFEVAREPGTTSSGPLPSG